MKKGFTLIELLAVVLLMGAILLLSTPAITGMLKKAEDAKIETFKTNVFLSAEAYLSDNRNKYLELKEVDKLTYVTINELITTYLNSNIINPYTNKQIKLDQDEMIVLVKKDSNNLYNYELVYYNQYFSSDKVEEEKVKINNALNSIKNMTTNTEEVQNKINLLTDSRNGTDANEIKEALQNRYNITIGG